MICRASAHFKELFKMKVLVVVDMQNDFINGALGTPEAQAVSYTHLTLPTIA